MITSAAATATGHAATAAAAAATAAAAAAAAAAVAASACTAANTTRPPVLADAVRALLAATQLKESAVETFNKLKEAADTAAWKAPLPALISQSVWEERVRAREGLAFFNVSSRFDYS